jgi:hypothetical protein
LLKIKRLQSNKEVHSSQVELDSLNLGVVGKSSLSKLTSDTRLLESSEGKLGGEHVVHVDPAGSGLEAVGDLHGGVDVLGVDSGSKTVGSSVSEGDDLVDGLELGDRSNGSEDLLLHDLHVHLNISEDSRLNEVTSLSETLSSGNDGSSLSLSGLNVSHDTLELKSGNLRSLEGVLGEGVSELVLGNTGLELFNEGVVNLLLDVDTGSSTAGLSVVEEDSHVGPLNGLVEVGVLEDDVGGLSSELEGDLLEVGIGGSLHDGASNEGGSSESDLVDVHVGGDSSSGNPSETGDDVKNSSGETSLLDEVGTDEGGEGSLLSGLQDNGVSGGKSRSDLPGPHEKGEVPGDNLSTDSDGLVLGVVEGSGHGVDDLSVDLVGPSSVVSQTSGSHGNITLGKGNGLSVVQRLNRGKEKKVLLHKVGELQEVLSAGRGGSGSPGSLEGGTGSLDGNVDIDLAGLLDGTDDLLGAVIDVRNYPNRINGNGVRTQG